MKRSLIKLKTKFDISNLETPVIGNITKLVDLYPITNEVNIPKEALDPSKWEIPDGYYAIEVINGIK